MKSSEIETAAQRAAEKWFVEARTVLETNRQRTGDNFADAGNASFDLATKKLAAIITTEFSALAEDDTTVESAGGGCGRSTLNIIYPFQRKRDYNLEWALSLKRLFK